MAEREIPIGVIAEAVSPERIVASPRREFLLSYKSPRGGIKEMRLVELTGLEQERNERLITRASAKDHRNLKKDRHYLGNYLFTKLVVGEGVAEEEFGNLWNRSARELYFIANELAQGKKYKEIDSSTLFLAGIADPKKRDQLEQALKEGKVSISDFRSKTGKLLTGEQVAWKMRRLQRNGKIFIKEQEEKSVVDRVTKEQSTKVWLKRSDKKIEEETVAEETETLVEKEMREVKKHLLLRRFFSVVPSIARRFYQFDLLDKTEKELRKHPNVAAVVGGAALLAIAADLRPEETSQVIKQGLEAADVFIKSQGWNLTPLGERTTQFIQEALPQVQSFSQHQSILLGLGNYLAQETQERWDTLSLAAKNAGLVEFSNEFASLSERVGESLVSLGRGVIDLANPATRHELIEKLARVGVDSLKMGLDLVAKGAVGAKDFLSQIAQQWGIENV